jgi:outer membrane protein insertion porin family
MIFTFHLYLCLFLFFAGDPAGARLKPGSGYGYGFGIRVDSALGPLRLEYAFNDKNMKRFHFGVGHRN